MHWKNWIFRYKYYIYIHIYIYNNRYGSFLQMVFDWLKVAALLQRGSLLFTTKFQEVPSTHWVDFGRMRG